MSCDQAAARNHDAIAARHWAEAARLARLGFAHGANTAAQLAMSHERIADRLRGLDERRPT